MARAINRLNVQTVRNIQTPGRHADGGGLYLNTTGGGRRWIFLYRWKGKPTEMGLGSARDISLARAREIARDAREKIALGVNPMTVRTPSEEKTFGQCADRLIENMTPSWRNPKHIAQWQMTMRDYAKPIREADVASIATQDVLKIIEPIWSVKPETASRIRGRIERVLDFAKAQGFRAGENPARWRGHLDQILPKRTRLSRGHHAALPYADVAAFMRELRAREAPAARALEFLILTAARTSEVLNVSWSEIDIAKKIWIVPATRMKAGREHRVPLSDATMSLLQHRPAHGKGLVFASTRVVQGERAPLSTMAMEMVLRRMKVEVTVHGFRSTFRDWASETTGFAHEVCEMALAHTIPNKAEAAYRRGDLFEKRRGLMEAWASYCGGNSRAEDAI